MDNRQIITNSIITDMSEGVMAIRFDGKIELVNDAALEILARTREELEGFYRQIAAKEVHHGKQAS